MTNRVPIRFACPNPSCDNHRKLAGTGIIRKGRSRSGRQEYKCQICGTRFSETTNTPLHRARIHDDDVYLICRMALEKNGSRSMERMTGHRRETVGRLLTALAEDPEFSVRYLLGSRKFTPSEVHEIIFLLSGWLKAHTKEKAKRPDS